MSARALFLLAASTVVLTSCATSPSHTARQNIRLTATLKSPTDITLNWRDRERGLAGHIVEFATQPNGKYTILQFLPPGATTFTHPDLIPRTPFYYRVRPYFGPASSPVAITLTKRPSDATARKKDGYRWAPPQALRQGPVATHSVRDGSAAAPTGLKGTVMHGDGIRFTWTDHANDEEGYLIEVRPAGKPDFGVVAVLDPNVNSFGLMSLPDEKVASYRVRAYYYGASSNLAHQRTGAGPPD